MCSFLLLSHLKIHNANALSSPYTIGFPAITAWLGATHALQRQLHKHGYADIFLEKLAIICHSLKVQRRHVKGDSTHLITVSRQPLTDKARVPDLLPEARCDVEVSLLIELGGSKVAQATNKGEKELFCAKVMELAYTMKWASGDVFSLQKVDTLSLDENVEILSLDDEEKDNKQLGKIRRMLQPGLILIERRSLIKNIQEKKEVDTLQALLDYLKITKIDAQSKGVKKSPGWLVPIAVGFQGITDVMQEPIANQRDESTPHRFAESILTLGEFIMPHRFDDIDEIMWHYEVDLDRNLYLCKNEKL